MHRLGFVWTVPNLELVFNQFVLQFANGTSSLAASLNSPKNLRVAREFRYREIATMSSSSDELKACKL